MGKSRIVPALCLFVFATLNVAGQQPPSIAQSLSSSAKRQLEREARLVVDLVQNYHESGRLFREIDNHEILTGFIAELDPNADFLLKDDVEFVHMRFGRTLRSVYLLKGDLQPAFEIFDLLSQRVKERTTWIDRRLAVSFNFAQAEAYTPETAPKPAANVAEADLRWDLKLKDEVLAEIVNGRTEPEARATVAKRYAKFVRRIETMDSLAVRESFFDGLLQTFDAHSGYFSADSTREFALEMLGTVAGIGLELKKENGLCQVSAIHPGGPADLTTDLRPGDIIEAYGDDGTALTPVKGRRLREIVSSIRGKAGTKLKLAYRHADEEQQHECLLERAAVVSISDRARGAISQVPAADGKIRRIGWIDLPMFYASNDGSGTSSATKDVTELLNQMCKTGVDGVVLDLRSNGGGALTEALALSGLFIPKGLVMLTRGLDGKRVEHFATESADLYSGPLVILTSAHSASASEIFTGAMKFHHRALIVGSPFTFGKGSVQNYIELAKTNRGQPEDAATWGTLRLTHDRFYQPDGQAVQRNGIAADIVLPQGKNPDFKREEALPHALPADTLTAPASAIPTAGIQNTITAPLLGLLRQFSEENIKKLPEWSLWLREQELFDRLTAKKERSLQQEKRLAEHVDAEAKLSALRTERRTLGRDLVFATETIEIASVQTAIKAHRARLATLTTASGSPGLNHLEHGAFIIKTEIGALRRLWLDQIEYHRFLGNSEPLAAAFSAGYGQHVTPAQIHHALQLLSLLEEHTESQVLKCFEFDDNSKADPVAIRKGFEVMLLRMVETDDELRRHRPALDVQLREGQRLTAYWADTLTAPQAVDRP